MKVSSPSVMSRLRPVTNSGYRRRISSVYGIINGAVVPGGKTILEN